MHLFKCLDKRKITKKCIVHLFLFFFFDINIDWSSHYLIGFAFNSMFLISLVQRKWQYKQKIHLLSYLYALICEHFFSSKSQQFSYEYLFYRYICLTNIWYTYVHLTTGFLTITYKIPCLFTWCLFLCHLLLS